VTALDDLGPDAGTVLAPLPGETALLRHGILVDPWSAIEARWRAETSTFLIGLGLDAFPATRDPETARTQHSAAFRELHAEFTMVRRSEVGATW
jgi:1,2-phenylacetyl-CoA epoxidase catalytic subunit